MRYISKSEAKKLFCNFCPYQEKDCSKECAHPLDSLDYIDVRVGKGQGPWVKQKENKERNK